MFKNLADHLATFSVRAICGIVACVPRQLTYSLLYGIAKLIMILQPRHLRVGRKNLELAFPDLSFQEREALLTDHLRSLARLLYDSSTLSTHDRSWAEQHVHFPKKAEHAKLESESKTGILIATGHLGSFELHAYSAAALGHPLSFVVRNFNLPKLDAWWCGTREKTGNSVINRHGAYKKIVKSLQSGRSVGILFDQNLVANNAVFVPWFGVDAATTKALAIAALKTKAPMTVSALCHTDGNNYELLWERCPVEQIYNDANLTKDEKIIAITKLATDYFTTMIRRYPSQWFWLHRRWKTRPDGSRYPYR